MRRQRARQRPRLRQAGRDPSRMGRAVRARGPCKAGCAPAAASVQDPTPQGRAMPRGKPAGPARQCRQQVCRTEATAPG
eukprot:296852-Lingulodinium_polyedra.AAC.1